MDKRRDAAFNGRDQGEGLNDAFNDEQQTHQNPARDNMSLDDSVRNYGEVRGNSFDEQSNTSTFSNIGTKNQGNTSSRDNDPDQGQDAGNPYKRGNDMRGKDRGAGAD